MTIERAHKQAIRQRQARTGEPYSVAARKAGRCTMIPILSDLRVPLQDRHALASICTWIRQNAHRLDEVHVVGIVVDIASLLAPPHQRRRLAPIDQVRLALDGISAAFPGRRTFLAPAPVRPATPAEARDLDSDEAETASVLADILSAAGWVAVETPYAIAPRVEVVNGIAVRNNSAHTAHARFERLNVNVVHGHTGRAGIVYRTIGDRTRWAMEVGHLNSVKPLSPDRQAGFGILHVDGDEVAPQFVRVKSRGTFIWGSRSWTPKGPGELFTVEDGRR